MAAAVAAAAADGARGDAAGVGLDASADFAAAAASTGASVAPAAAPRLTVGQVAHAALVERLAAIATDGVEASKTRLDFLDQHVGDDGVEQLVRGLATHSALRFLGLQRCQLTGRGFEAVGRLLYDGGRAAKMREQAIAREATGGGPPKEAELAGGSADGLAELVLSGNECGPGGLRGGFCEGLATSVALQKLSLSCCGLGPAGVAVLCEVLASQDTAHSVGCKLVELSLAQNDIGPEGARSIARALGTNERLRVLDLKANGLGVEGAAAVADLIYLNKGRLQRLDVTQNDMLLEGVRTVVERFRLPVQFTVKLHRPKGHSIGMGLNSEVHVMGVHPTGVVDRWNMDNPSEAIIARDRVIRVNAFTEADEMLTELAEATDVEVELFRPDVGLSFLDLAHNSVPLPGLEELRLSLGRLEADTRRGGLLDVDGGKRRVSLSAF